MPKNKRKDKRISKIGLKLCSACLLGINCRYDGKNKLNKKVLRLTKKEILIPVCPEILGGLPTPREQAKQKGTKVITKSGKDVTKYFKKGAKEVLKVAKLFNAKEAILKQESPSCGSGKIKKGNGVTTALLRKNKIKVFSEEDL